MNWTFSEHVRPLLNKYCSSCHDAATTESGINLEQLTGAFAEKHLFLWSDVAKQLSTEAMPPEDEDQPTTIERRHLIEWINEELNKARSRSAAMNGSVRRLTVAQYRNTMRELLLLDDDLTGVLPPDAISKDGFVNNGDSMLLSPLLLEAFFAIAEQSLDLCIVDESARPMIQNFRMEFGKAINKAPCPDQLILGARSMLLNNANFQISELTPDKPFVFTPHRFPRTLKYIEGYQGNDTVRGMRTFEGIYHSVFACVRGDVGYPKGEPYDMAPEGMLLRPAIPSPEIFGESSTYGPKANFKISLRELPDHGNFRVKVRAAAYRDGLLLENDTPISRKPHIVVDADQLAANTVIDIAEPGIYQVDAYFNFGKNKDLFTLQIGDRYFTGRLKGRKIKRAENEPDDSVRAAAFLVARFREGEHAIKAAYGSEGRLKHVSLTRLDDDDSLAQCFETFEARAPILGVHVGLRRDCGSTLNRVGKPVPVATSMVRNYWFEGAIRDYPSPNAEKGNLNYLAGIREIGVRSEYTDGRDRPRLLIESIEFEGPYYESWPPRTHKNIFVGSTQSDDPEQSARAIIHSFATRAFRRPITDAEFQSLLSVWQSSYATDQNFSRSIKDVLLVVLTAPQFLFLIEQSETPEPEDLDPHELASKLSYFLWNGPPDEMLFKRAAAGSLHQTLDDVIDQMIADRRFSRFVDQFASQWLSLDKFDVVKTNRKKYPTLTRDTKTQLRREPIEFLEYLLQQNLPLHSLIESDFVVANEVVADYYGLESNNGFEFARVDHDRPHLGGILTNAAILAGLSDGNEPNAIKRGAWFARKIIAEPPDDPPPNVPELEEDESAQLTLRQKLERHRDVKGCANCHAGIDPWGLPFEQYDAGGLFKADKADHAASTLPDGTDVADLAELKEYLLTEYIDQVAFSFLKHLATYATGRRLSYNEVQYLKEHVPELKLHGFKMQDMLRFVIKSDLFLKK